MRNIANITGNIGEITSDIVNIACNIGNITRNIDEINGNIVNITRNIGNITYCFLILIEPLKVVKFRAAPPPPITAVRLFVCVEGLFSIFSRGISELNEP